MTGIDVRRVTGYIGAEITGVRLDAGLSGPVQEIIRHALHEHKVLFFHGQDHLDDAGQAAFARRFGDLTVADPAVPGGGEASAWHTDATFTGRPPAVSILRAVTVPPYGGDTAWANTATAYQTLAPELRELAGRLWAVHANDCYETEHPVVRVHPDTGERTLLLGQFVRHILGVPSADSKYLFEEFQRHITRLENTVRWRWSPGDVAIWDNRATQHYEIGDHGDLPRRMHRVAVAGDVPVSMEGRRSIARSGYATAAR